VRRQSCPDALSSVVACGRYRAYLARRADLFFFETQAFGVNKNPHRARVRLDTALSQFRRQLPHREWSRADALPQPIGIGAGQGSLLVAVILPGRKLPVSRRSFFHLEMQDGLI